MVEDFRTYGVLPEKRTCARLVANSIKVRKFVLADTVLRVLETKKGASSVMAFSSAMLAYNKLHMYRRASGSRLPESSRLVVLRCDC
jgi:hypothetical protein